MKTREVRDILAFHADQLIIGRTSPNRDLARHEQVSALLALAEQVQGILVPVVPDADYRRRLHGELVLNAQSRETEPGSSRFRQHRKGIIIGAAAVGSVASVVGVVVAFIMYLRHGRATHIATS